MGDVVLMCVQLTGRPAKRVSSTETSAREIFFYTRTPKADGSGSSTIGSLRRRATQMARQWKGTVNLIGL